MLPDLFTDNLKLVICGTAAGNTSARLQQYYAKPGNKFWKTLFEVGLTPVLLAPTDYKNLLKYQIGLTDLVKHKSGLDSGLLRDDFGREALRKKIEQYQPNYFCFNGKRAAEEFLLKKVEFGLQLDTIGATHFFVAPSTSGAANGWWNIEIWREVARLCGEKQ